MENLRELNEFLCLRKVAEGALIALIGNGSFNG
jgi:hypothetical protein